MSDEYEFTVVAVVVKFIKVASWHKRAWDFGRENNIFIPPQKEYHFFPLLFINYFSCIAWVLHVSTTTSAAVNNDLHNAESLL